jgi:large subunit ribosomal protein L19e
MAAEILKIGQNRVWVDPEKIDDVGTAISREEIRKLIHEDAIRKMPEKGVSRARARIFHEKRKMGKRRGHGSRTGAQGARTPSKEAWERKIRALRSQLHEMRGKHVISEEAYRRLYIMAKSGSFESVSDLRRYMEAHDLRRKR